MSCATASRLTSPGSLVGVEQSLKAAVWYTVTKVGLFCHTGTQREHVANALRGQIAQEEGMHRRLLVRNTVQNLTLAGYSVSAELSLPFAASEHFVAALAEVVFQQACKSHAVPDHLVSS